MSGMIVMAGDVVPGLSPQAQYECCVETLKLAELGYDGYVAMEFLATGDPVTAIARAREEALAAAAR